MITNELLLVPPEVLMGEAGICSFWAMVAVAYVFQRNQQMNGWQEPNIQAALAAALWPMLPDTSGGANYAFSTQDLMREDVRKIIAGTSPKVVWMCNTGELAFY